MEKFDDKILLSFSGSNEEEKRTRRWYDALRLNQFRIKMAKDVATFPREMRNFSRLEHLGEFKIRK